MPDLTYQQALVELRDLALQPLYDEEQGLDAAYCAASEGIPLGENETWQDSLARAERDLSLVRDAIARVKSAFPSVPSPDSIRILGDDLPFF